MRNFDISASFMSDQLHYPIEIMTTNDGTLLTV